MFATWLVLRPLLEHASAPCGILVGRCGVLPKEGLLQGHWVRASNSEVRQQTATRDAMVFLVAIFFETAI